MAYEKSEILSFIESYRGDASKICFQSESTDEGSIDRNEAFRSAVVDQVLEKPQDASQELLAALYRGLTEHSAEAWGADPRMEEIGKMMLIRGGVGAARDYILGAWQSFDAHCATSFVGCPRPLAEDCLRFAQEQVSVAKDEDEQALWEMGVERFENLLKHSV